MHHSKSRPTLRYFCSIVSRLTPKKSAEVGINLADTPEKELLANPGKEDRQLGKQIGFENPKMGFGLVMELKQVSPCQAGESTAEVHKKEVDDGKKITADESTAGVEK